MLYDCLCQGGWPVHTSYSNVCVCVCVGLSVSNTRQYLIKRLFWNTRIRGRREVMGETAELWDRVSLMFSFKIMRESLLYNTVVLPNHIWVYFQCMKVNSPFVLKNMPTVNVKRFMCSGWAWSSALSFKSRKVSLFVLNDKQEVYHSKPQWHSKASIFTTCKHQWPNLKDWLIPLLTWLRAGGCAYERHLFNSARCRGERVMSFKLPCYACPCLGFAIFQVQAYFEDGAQSHKPSE